MIDQDWIKSLLNIPVSHVAGIFAASTVIYFVSSCFYNLYLHPLRKIPGPKLAAIGPYLEFYHEVLRDGQYLWEISKMHDKYGKICRDAPCTTQILTTASSRPHRSSKRPRSSHQGFILLHYYLYCWFSQDQQGPRHCRCF